MKNNSLKIISIIGILAILYLLAVNIGYCAADTAAQTAQTAASTAAATTAVPADTIPKANHAGILIKFVWAMGGVILSSLVIFGGLTLYKKIFSVKLNYNQITENILKTPKTIDDAIIFFIKKNKLN